MIADTYFTSLATKGGNVFSRHTKKWIMYTKTRNYILSLIFMLVTNVNGGETLF